MIATHLSVRFLAPARSSRKNVCPSVRSFGSSLSRAIKLHYSDSDLHSLLLALSQQSLRSLLALSQLSLRCLFALFQLSFSSLLAFSQVPLNSMKKMNYSNITTRIIYWRFYTLLFLDINVSYHLQTFINRICSFEKELNIDNHKLLHINTKLKKIKK